MPGCAAESMIVTFTDPDVQRDIAISFQTLPGWVGRWGAAHSCGLCPFESCPCGLPRVRVAHALPIPTAVAQVQPDLGATPADPEGDAEPAGCACGLGGLAEGRPLSMKRGASALCRWGLCATVPPGGNHAGSTPPHACLATRLLMHRCSCCCRCCHRGKERGNDARSETGHRPLPGWGP
jgi:hypothetical protein